MTHEPGYLLSARAGALDDPRNPFRLITSDVENNRGWSRTLASLQKLRKKRRTSPLAAGIAEFN